MRSSSAFVCRLSAAALHRLVAFSILLTLAAVLAPAPPAHADAPEAKLLRFPDIHRDVVVFVYGGDIWRAPSAGGEARRLTSHVGQELFPKISRDGQWVAFSAEYSGTRQVWVVPIDGGAPRQLTFYADVGEMAPRGGYDYWVLGWTPTDGADGPGKILVRANRVPWGERMGRYFLVDPRGGLETPLELPEGGGASLSPDGTRLAYTPVSREFRTWKRTRGGRAQDVWIFDLEEHRSERLTDFPGTDNFPMWTGDTVYFTSDRSDKLNLFAYDLVSRQTRQVTDFAEHDVLWPALGPEAIAFMLDGEIHRLDLASGQSTRIPIRIGNDLPATIPHFRDVSSNVRGATISPAGKRVVAEARGELFSIPTEHGPTRNLSHTQGVREIEPTFSPDGHWLAYLSDASGEYEIYLRPADRSATPRRLTTDGSTWRQGLMWSPDSTMIAFADAENRLWTVAVEDGTLNEVHTSLAGVITSYQWSPDSRWLAFDDMHPETRLQAIWAHSLESAETHLLGDGMSTDFGPAWSADGKHLFFLSNRDFNLRFSSFEFDYLYDRATRIYVAALDPEADPLLPYRSDEVEPREEKKEKEKDDWSDSKDDDDAKSPPLRVEPAGFLGRTISLPGVAAGNYANLVATENAVYYLRFGDGGGSGAVVRYDLESRKEETVVEGTQGFNLSADGTKVLYRQGAGLSVVAAKPGQSGGALDLSGLRVKVDPRAEWRQIFTDGWRITRDFFYDPDMHGVDWQAIRERYAPLVDHVAHRAELDWILGEMVSELEAGHTYVQSGDHPRVDRVPGGMLGCELELDAASGRFRIARILPGENWDPAWRSPLTEPGVDISEGDYVLAIDAENLAHPDNPYRLLEGKADRQVTLRVAASPDGETRDVVVRPISSELNLRYLEWVQGRMAMVERLSGGRIGYLHLPDTAIAGNRMLQKLFYGQTRKEALIVDDRYNGGGFIPDPMIDYLARTTRAYWAQRGGEGFRTPGFAHDGPKAMLINGYSSSGGDALPYYFRQAGLGPLIGTRTWGGLIGISGAPALADGGAVLPPTFRIFDANGKWVVENEGVAPDIEVIDLPEAILAGGDPSLEKAVEVLLEQLETDPVRHPETPQAPDLSGPTE